MRPRHYDQEGNPMGLSEWAEAMEDIDARLIGSDKFTVHKEWPLWLRWLKWLVKPNRAYPPETARVSTVWLGLDHQFGDGPPLIFETMIFGGPHDQAQWRYSTKQEAKEGHLCVVIALRDGADPYDRMNALSVVNHDLNGEAL